LTISQIVKGFRKYFKCKNISITSELTATSVYSHPTALSHAHLPLSRNCNFLLIILITAVTEVFQRYPLPTHHLVHTSTVGQAGARSWIQA